MGGEPLFTNWSNHQQYASALGEREFRNGLFTLSGLVFPFGGVQQTLSKALPFWNYRSTRTTLLKRDVDEFC
jgi:hypothetical protein